MAMSGVFSWEKDVARDWLEHGWLGNSSSESRCATYLSPSLRTWMASTTPQGIGPPNALPKGVAALIDGRLDNRRELMELLGMSFSASGWSDAGVIAAGYYALGLEIFEGLVGEWALALYDPLRDALILACDYPGARPIYYVEEGNAIAWSTEIPPLLRWSRSRAIDDGYLVRYILSRPRAGITPYRKIRQVEGGTGLVIGRRGTQRFRHFKFQPKVGDLKASAEEICTSFKVLLSQAVRDRMRGDVKCAVELSGGFDSSSVACLADEIWKTGNFDPSKVVTVTYVSDDPTSAVDKPYVAAVNERVQFQNTQIDDDEVGLLFPRAGNSRFMTFPIVPAGRQMALAKMCEAEKVELLVSGGGGDAIGWSVARPYALLADLWDGKRLWSLQKELRAASRSFGVTLWRLFWSDVVLFKRTLKRGYKGTARPDNQWAPWVMQAAQVRESVAVNRFSHLPPSVEFFYVMIESIRQVLSEDLFNLSRPARVTYPFLDKRLIEFAASVPVAFKVESNMTRLMHRRALVDVLPSQILGRRGKATGNVQACREIRRHWGTVERLLDKECRLAEYRLVDVDRLRRSLIDARDSGKLADPPVLKALSAEFWMRQNESSLSNLT